MDLRYGINPHQRPATLTPVDADRPPIRVVNGCPSYINVLDAVNGWQLVHNAARVVGLPAAASFKHVSPAGAAVSGPLDAVMTRTYDLADDAVSAVTSAYVRARDADPKSSYGDLVAVSEPLDAQLADLLRRVVCDGVIAPDFEPGVVASLASKKRGTFLILQADPGYRPPALESREIFGLRLTQPRDEATIRREDLMRLAPGLPARALDDVLLGLVVTRYTQSNSVAYLRDGMALGIGAGQQSRIDCTRLAGAKVDTWWLRRHPTIRDLPIGPDTRIQDRITRQLAALDDTTIPPHDRAHWLGQLDQVSFVSDGAIPFTDNIEQAHAHGVRHLAEPGGSIRTAEVRATCQTLGITHLQTGIRLFHH